MRRYDLAIRGCGMLPGLLVVHLLQRDPSQSLLLLSGEADVAGQRLEPVVASSLSASARALVDPFVVARWPGYLTSRNGQYAEVPGEVLLLDPVQLWLELQALLAPDDLAVAVDGIVRQGGTLSWRDQTAAVADLVDLDSLTRREEAEEILGLDAVRALALPVLVDFDTGGQPWDAFQHIPLGDERVYVRKRLCHGDPETELTQGLGRLLSDMIAF